MSSVFLEDGYTEEFRINPRRGLHGALTGTFRPMLPDERDTMYELAGKRATRVEQNAVYRRVIASHIKSWDALDSKGNKAASIEHGLRYLRPGLWDRVFNIVTGADTSDLPPDLSAAAPQADDIDRRMKAAAEGLVEPSGLEGDAKN